jgi:hypothetical protein
MVVVALGEPGVPLISCAGAGKVTNITATVVRSDKPLWISFREAAFSRHHLWGVSAKVRF